MLQWKRTVLSKDVAISAQFSDTGAFNNYALKNELIENEKALQFEDIRNTQHVCQVFRDR